MRRPRVLVIAVLAALLVGVPAAAGAQEATTGFRLPVDASQGPLLADGGTPYRFDLAAHPSYQFGESLVRVGPVISLDFANPDWALGFGARASMQVFRPADFFADVGLRLALEYRRTTDDRDLLGAGLIGDPDGLLRIGVWGGYDWGVDAAWLKLSIGIDLTAWHRPAEGPPDFGEEDRR